MGHRVCANKVEHRLFRHITQNWRGRPPTSRLSAVESIAATTTTAGLDVECELDTGIYAKGVKVTDAEMKLIELRGDAFHHEWNFTINPWPKTTDACGNIFQKQICTIIIPHCPDDPVI